jgi:hypothetical protein
MTNIERKKERKREVQKADKEQVKIDENKAGEGAGESGHCAQDTTAGGEENEGKAQAGRQAAVKEGESSLCF